MDLEANLATIQVEDEGLKDKIRKPSSKPVIPRNNKVVDGGNRL